MNDQDMRSRNRRIGALVLAAMLVMALLTAVYAYSTIDFRRHVDAVQPDARPLKRDLATVGLLFALVGSVTALAIVARRRRRQK